ncbi:MAG: helix-turn-helix domain-containing protein [Isosphaeraceae bacterium]
MARHRGFRAIIGLPGGPGPPHTRLPPRGRHHKQRGDHYLGVEEAAKFLGVVPKTIRIWRDRGRIPECRLPANNYRMFTRADLRKLLEQIKRSRKGTRSTR